MTRGINKVILVGNCGADPEMRTLPSGQPVVQLRLATTSSWTDKGTGQKNEKTEWHRVVFYQRAAEIISQYVRKGTQMYIEGSLRYGQYEKEGVTHYTTDIVGRDFQFLGGRDNNSSDGGSRSSGSFDREPRANTGAAEGANFDDDIPF